MGYKVVGSVLCKYCKNCTCEKGTAPIHATSGSMFYGTKSLYSCSKKIFTNREYIPSKYECNLFTEKR